MKELSRAIARSTQIFVNEDFLDRYAEITELPALATREAILNDARTFGVFVDQQTEDYTKASTVGDMLDIIHDQCDSHNMQPSKKGA